MKPFYPDGSDLFLGDKAPIHRALGVTDWFDEFDKDGIHVLWPLHHK